MHLGGSLGLRRWQRGRHRLGRRGGCRHSRFGCRGRAGLGLDLCRNHDRDLAALRQLVQSVDQDAVVTRRLVEAARKRVDDHAYPVGGAQDQPDPVAVDPEGLGAQLVEDRLAGMGDLLQPGQAEKAAGALDGVDQAEDQRDGLLVVGCLFEPHEGKIELGEALQGLGHKIGEQIVQPRLQYVVARHGAAHIAGAAWAQMRECRD